MLQKQIVDFSEFASYEFTKKATVYHEDSVSPKAVLLYFHGGGLLYGNREDLPEKHLRTFTEKGYVLAAMDYPLAPAVTLPGILEDVLDSVNRYEEVLTAAGLVTEDEMQNTLCRERFRIFCGDDPPALTWHFWPAPRKSLPSNLPAFCPITDTAS